MSRKTRPLVALGLVAMVVAISGCGSSGSAATGNGGGDLTATVHARAVRFAECIRSKGVSEFPDPNASGQFVYGIPSTSSPLDPNSAAWKQAIAACKRLEPLSFMPTHFTPAQMSARQKFAQCVRANGVPDFPDPTATGPLIAVSNASSIPGLHTAIQKCIHLNPAAVQ